jgi:hypothetical protein
MIGTIIQCYEITVRDKTLINNSEMFRNLKTWMCKQQITSSFTLFPVQLMIHKTIFHPICLRSGAKVSYNAGRVRGSFKGNARPRVLASGAAVSFIYQPLYISIIPKEVIKAIPWSETDELGGKGPRKLRNYRSKLVLHNPSTTQLIIVPSFLDFHFRHNMFWP